MIVRFGSARTTASSTSSSTTMITRSAANAASFWQPSSPQTWVSPLAVARWAWMIATSGFNGGTAYTRPSPYGEFDRPDQRIGDRQVGLEVRAQREEWQVHRAGRVPPDHPEVAVLLDRQRLVGDIALDPPPDRPEAAHSRVAEPREDELRRHPARDHLVVDDVRGEPGQGQVAPTLADDLVPRREADEVGEPLDRHGVAVADQLGDGVVHRRDLGRHRAVSPPPRPRGSRRHRPSRRARHRRCPRPARSPPRRAPGRSPSRLR